MSISNANTFTWPTEFSCVLVLDDVLLPIDYRFTMTMEPDIESAGMGLRKVKEFFHRYINNSIVVSKEHEFLPLLIKLKTNTVELPQDPNDLLLACILFKKLTSIAENYFVIKDITIDSNIGDHVKYTVSNFTKIYDKVLETTSWWNQDDLSTNNHETFPSWEDLSIVVSNKFSPKILKGGRDESKQI